MRDAHLSPTTHPLTQEHHHTQPTRVPNQECKNNPRSKSKLRTKRHNSPNPPTSRLIILFTKKKKKISLTQTLAPLSVSPPARSLAHSASLSGSSETQLFQLSPTVRPRTKLQHSHCPNSTTTHHFTAKHQSSRLLARPPPTLPLGLVGGGGGGGKSMHGAARIIAEPMIIISICPLLFVRYKYNRPYSSSCSPLFSSSAFYLVLLLLLWFLSL